MKKVLLLSMILLFGIMFAGCKCNNENNYIRLSDRVFVRVESSYNNETEGNNEKLSKIKEEEYPEMLEIPQVDYSIDMDIPYIPIVLRSSDDDVVFYCTCAEPEFTLDLYGEKIKQEEKIYWLPPHKIFEEPIYIDIILKKGSNIIGYAVISIVSPKAPDGSYIYAWRNKILKTSIFPKIKGRYQNITDEQVKMLISNVKKESNKCL